MHHLSQALASTVRELLGEQATWENPGGYPDSLALCIVDSIYSIGVRYASVQAVVKRYQAHRSAAGQDAIRDGAPALAQTFLELGGVQEWAQVIGNGHRTYSRMHAPLKAQVVQQAAEALIACDVRTTSDLREVALEKENAARNAWLRLPSQRSGVSWAYLLMLAKVDGVKPDRMILRFLERHLPEDHGSFSSAEAAELLTDTAQLLGVSATVLDHRIWQHQRTQ